MVAKDGRERKDVFSPLQSGVRNGDGPKLVEDVDFL